MSKFEYPQLPRSDIINGVGEYGNIPVSDADIRYPKPDFISNLYTRLLIQLDIINEDYEQVDFGALEQLENPDHHRTSVRMMTLLKKTKGLLAAIDCPRKFCLKDLIKPDPERTEMFLSALVNFCVHRSSKMELLQPIVDEHRLVEDRGKELEDRIFELNAEIDKVTESKEREKPLVQAVNAEVNELSQTINALNNQQMSLKAVLKKMKEEEKDIDERISSAEFALVQSVQENASLRSKIVQSPDKLQSMLEEKKIVRAEARDAERISMQTYQEKNGILEVYTKAHKKLSKTLAQVQAIQEQVNSAKTVEKDVKALKVQQSDQDMLDKTLEANLIERQGRVEQVDESTKQLEKERDLKYEEVSKELNDAKFGVELKRRDLELRQKKIEAAVAEAESITVEINAIEEAGHAGRLQLAGKCEEIVTEFYKYNKSIGSQFPSMEVDPELAH